MDDSTAKSLFPESNSICASHIYVVEVALRELIVEELEKLDGPKWYKNALPGAEMMKKYKEAKDYQRKKPWSHTIPLHPVYYLDFPHLAEVINKRDNWERCFKRVFCPSRGNIVSTLQNLEPIRNDLAHNRKVHENNINMVKAAVDFLANCLGDERIVSLACRCTNAVSISQSLKSLRSEIETTRKCVQKASSAPHNLEWHTIKNAWWFDSEYLETDLKPLLIYFNLVSSYDEILKGRGLGYKSERWANDNDFFKIANEATSVIDMLLKEQVA